MDSASDSDCHSKVIVVGKAPEENIMFYTFFFALALLDIVAAQADSAGKKCKYAIQLMEDVKLHEGCKNPKIDPTGLKLGNADTNAVLAGMVDMGVAIDGTDKISLSIFKETDNGIQYVGEADGEICKNLDDEDTPWYSIVKAMDITKCPIEAGQYDVQKMEVEMGSFEEFMGPQYVGMYNAVLSIIQDDEAILMAGVAFGINEISCED